MTLPIALGAMAVMGAMTTSVITYSTANYSTANRSNADQQALALAEAGLNYAYSTLYAAVHPDDGASVPDTTVELEAGSARYYGTLAGSTWTLTGIGTVQNATGRTAPVVRTVSGRVNLGSALVSSPNNAIWNYVYSDATVGCTSLQNTVVIDVPLYIRGSLCMSNSATMTGHTLRVGGNLTLANSSAIGSSGSPIFEASIGGTCQYAGGALHSPCGPADHVYATNVGTNPPGLFKPQVDLPRWYRDSQPGPLHACTTGSFPGGFDNDTLMNHSRGPVNLTPATAYDCRVRDATGFEVGRLSWTPGSPGTLAIHGTIFFDGDISFSQQNIVNYTGRAVIYTSGVVTLANHTHICGAPGCPMDWNPNVSLLSIVAGSIDGQADGFTVGNYSNFQGAIYTVNDFREGNNSQVWGPVISRQVYLQNSTLIHFVPIETLLPGMPATYEETIALSNVPGSWG